MSAQSAKKKRLGSRRRGTNQNEQSKTESHIVDSTFVAQHQIPEENIESYAFASPSNSQYETKHPPSPEFSGNRRKLGSSRRLKGKHFKESATELYHEPREEVGEKTEGMETTITTQMSLAIQHERQEVISQESATHDSYLCSATTPDNSSEVQNTTAADSAEAELESLFPQSKHLQTDPDKTENESKVSSELVEPIQEEIDRSDTSCHEEVIESAHLVDISELTSLSVLSRQTIEQQLMDQSDSWEMLEEKLPSVYFETEKECKTRDNTELFKQDGNFQGNGLVSESHVESVVMQFSNTPEIPTEKVKPREVTDVECSIGQAAISSPKEELHDEEHNQDPVVIVHEKEVMPTVVQPQIGLVDDATEIFSGNLTVKTTDDSHIEQDISNPDDKHNEHPPKRNNNFEALEQTDEDHHVYYTNEAPLGDTERVDTAQSQAHEPEDQVSSAELKGHQEGEGLFSEMEENESTSQTQQSEINAPFDSELQENHTVFNPIGNRRKLGSSRRHRGRRHVRDSAAESHHEPTEDNVGLSTDEEQNDIFMLSQAEGADQSEDAVNKLHEQEVTATEIQEMPQLGFSSESMIHDAMEKSEITSGNLLDPTEVSVEYKPELVLESADDSPSNQEISIPDDKQFEHPTKENNTESLVQKDEDQYVVDTNKLLISDIEKVDTTLGQVNQTEDQVEDDMKPSAELTGHQEREGLFSEMEENESSSQTLQSEINSPFDSELQENNAVFNLIGNRRKLGSSRRHRGRRHVEDSAAESHHEPTEDDVGNIRDNEPFDTTDMLLTIDTAEQEKSIETMLEEMEKFKTAQTEDVCDEVREKAHVGTDFYSSPAGDEQTVDQSNFREMAGENLLNVSVTEEENEKREVDTQLFQQDESLPTNYLVSELHVKSEDIQFSVLPEITTDKQSSREQTEPECRVEQAAFSSSKEELSTNEEENEIFSLSEAEGADQSEDAVNKVHEQEVTATEMQEMPQLGFSSESVIHSSIENPEITSGNLVDPTEVSVEYKPELVLESADDSPSNQEISIPDDKQFEHPTKGNNTESLLQKDEDHYVVDTNKLLISDIEKVDTTPGQVNETEDQVEDDMKPSAELTGHQEKEGLLSEMEENESSSQTLQSEINAPFDSELQENNAVFNPIGNRRKLGSSRRHRGRRHVEDSAAESHHEPTEDDVGNIRDNEPFDTTDMLLTIDTAEQEKSIETMLEEMEKFKTAQTEDVGDEVREKAHVGADFYSSSTGDEQTVDQSNFREMAGENLSVSGTEEENKEKGTDTEFFQQDESLQTNYLVSDSHVKSEDVQFSISPEITTDKQSSREQTEPECRVEQAAFSSSKEELSTNEEQNEIFSLSEAEGADQSEDAVNKVHEQEVTATEMQEMPQLGFSSESVIHSSIENPEITSGNLVDPTEVSVEYKPELVLESADDSPSNQEISIPDDKQFEHPTKGNNTESLLQKDEDHYVVDTNKLLISDIEKVDTTPGQVNETEDQVEDDMKPSAELTGHQEKEGLFSEMEENESSSQTLQSEINAPFDSELQENNAVFNPIGNRRKLGSSRRHRGRRHVEDSAAESHHEPTEDDVGNIRDNEPFDTTQMLLTVETAEQEKSIETMLEEIDKFNTAQTEDVSVKSEDKQFSITLETTTEKSSPGEHTEIECSVEQAAFSSSAEHLFTNEEQKEHVNLSQVGAAQHSEAAACEVHEQEVKATQMQEMQQINNSFIKDSESPSQALKSESNAPLDSEPLDNSTSIKEQTHSGFSTTGSRRKLGSSRRNKGQLHVKDSTKISLVTETGRQEELKEQTNMDFEPTGEIRTRSPVNDRVTAEKMLEDGIIFTQNVTENSNDDEKKLRKEPEDLSQLTGSDTVEKDAIQSPEVSLWKHESDKLHSDVLKEEEAFQVKNMKALACDKENKLQQPNETSQTVGDFMTTDQYKGAESLMCAQVSGQAEYGEQFEDPTKKEHDVQEMNVSQEITQAELFSFARSKTETLAPFDIGPEENMEAEPAVDVSEERDISSQQGRQEKTHLDDGENLHGKNKQKKRKMGSTRRSLLSRKPEEIKDETEGGDFKTEAEPRNPDKVEVVEELPVNLTTEVLQKENLLLSPVNTEQQETTETTTVNNISQEWSIESNMIPAMDYSKTLLPEQSSPHNEEVVHPVVCVNVPSVRDSERNVDVEPSKIDFIATEMHIRERARGPVNPSLSANTEDTTNTGIPRGSFVSSSETTQNMQNEDEKSESVNVKQHQAEVSVVVDLEMVKSVVRGGDREEHRGAQAGEEEADNTNEEANSLNMKNASPNLNSPHRRRKLGSTRRNLGSRSKQEDVRQNQEVDDEAKTAATAVDVKTLSGIKEDEQELHREHKDDGSGEREEKGFKTVEYSHTGESHIKAPAQQSLEENPDSKGEIKETELQLTPSYVPATLSTSPNNDLMSESVAGGRRRKMGSHRKSRGHQNKESAGGVTDESALKTSDETRGASSGLVKISQVVKSDQKAPSSTSSSKAGGQSVSEKTHEPVAPVQHPYTKINLGQESHQKISLAGNPTGANSFNVMMVGDSSVGKTSFMKRAQSGKFSLDLPASVGLDSCMWTVVVDGKPVVLKLWDTAGQERFHSITKQMFHKAHAFLLMYDITSSHSFSAVSYWASCIQEGAAENVTILLVGNKSDCAERQVKTHEAEILAKEYNFEFVECSAATGENVVQSLETVARMLSQKDDTRQEAVVLHKEPQQKKSSGCC